MPQWAEHKFRIHIRFVSAILDALDIQSKARRFGIAMYLSTCFVLSLPFLFLIVFATIITVCYGVLNRIWSYCTGVICPDPLTEDNHINPKPEWEREIEKLSHEELCEL